MPNPKYYGNLLQVSPFLVKHPNFVFRVSVAGMAFSILYMVIVGTIIPLAIPSARFATDYALIASLPVSMLVMISLLQLIITNVSDILKKTAASYKQTARTLRSQASEVEIVKAIMAVRKAASWFRNTVVVTIFFVDALTVAFFVFKGRHAYIFVNLGFMAVSIATAAVVLMQTLCTVSFQSHLPVLLVFYCLNF